MSRSTWFAFLLVLLAEVKGETQADLVFHVKLHKDSGHCIVLSDSRIVKFRGFRSERKSDVAVDIRRATQGLEGDDPRHDLKDATIVELYSRDRMSLESYVKGHCGTTSTLESINNEDVEIVKIVDGGPSSNRIDVVFMGDGYTLPERHEFLNDIRRLTSEMFQGVTFRSYLPLFNIWAVFVPSVESGIGYNGAKNTPFRLYRQGGQLRGIYTGNASYARAVCAMVGPSGCDYPSLIGNDDYYGGLGGEFVISTRSNRTGTVVLRHEMGHNFVNVGEEYDNGQVYRGVNSAASVNTLGWGHWLTNNASRREERSMWRVLEYPWQDLGQRSWSANFTSDGSYHRWSIQVSVSAAGESDSLEFMLDDAVLPWTTTGFEDREFYGWTSDVSGFGPGTHSFSVRSKTTPTNPDIPRMICSVRIHEFGDSDEFEADQSHVSAYPTWDVNRRKTFRPTNAGCLMRNMTFTEFCPVCQEGMWYQFLQRISLIDSVGTDIAPGNPDGSRSVTLRTLELGHLRQPGNEVAGEQLHTAWIRDGHLQDQMNDKFRVDCLPGNWTVRVNLVTPEVKADRNGLLIDTQIFIVSPQ